jgi:hypothetical protein
MQGGPTVEVDKIKGQNALINLLLLSLAGVGGYFWLAGPLASSRPTAAPSHGHPAVKDEDVDARLWQDPFATAVRHIEQEREHLPGHAAAVHRLDTLQREVQSRSGPSLRRAASLLMMPVMVRSEASAEDEELRLRSRYAVVTALGAVGYAPRDSGHIGVLELFHWQEAGTLGRWDASENENPDAERHALLIPYEWFEPDLLIDRGQIADSVLVLWLPDEAFSDEPLVRLARLFRALLATDRLPEGSSRSVRIKVIGPAGSPTLRAMKENRTALLRTLPTRLARAASTLSLGDVAGAVRRWWSDDTLRGVTIHSPWATAPQVLLDYKQPFPLLTMVSERLSLGPQFVPAIGTDDQTILALLEELCLRGVDSRVDPIALVTESDTFYGRALPLVFAAAVQCLRAKSGWSAEAESARESLCRGGDEDQATFTALVADCARDLSQYYVLLSHDPDRWPDRIRAFTYLRGVDGLVPGSSPADEGAGVGDKNDRGTRRRLRRPEGPAQYDFLRRLERAGELNELRDERHAAIGVLGSDVYDKLLLLQALRETHRKPLYFTTDLDARLAHPDEWMHTRNLIVASHYGLEPPQSVADVYRPRRVAPFRDAYQTAVFIACLQALGRCPDGVAVANPEVYEIGRDGPYNLSDIDRRAHLHWGMIGTGGLAVCLLALLSVPIFLSWRSTGKLELSSWECSALGCGALMAVLLGWRIWVDHDRPSGEPWTLSAGISVWPTTAIRLFAAAVAVWLMVRGHIRLGRATAHGQTATMFSRARKTTAGSEPAAAAIARHDDERCRIEATVDRTQRRSAVTRGPARLLAWRSGFSLCRWAAPLHPESTADEKRIDVPVLWEGYLMRGRARYRVTRFAVHAVLYLVFGWCILELYGWPSIPYRGTASAFWESWIVKMSVAAMVLLIFYVVDATRLCARFVNLLAAHPSCWPPDALTEHRAGDPPRSALEHPGLGAPSAVNGAPCREWLDINLIGAQTDAVGKLIYYPMIVILLMLLARTSYLDNWGSPFAILLLIAINFGYAVICAVLLRRAAESARWIAVQRLVASRLTADGADVPRIDFTLRRIEEYRVGAFAPLSQQPVAQVLVLPSGGFGAWALIEWLMVSSPAGA